MDALRRLPASRSLPASPGSLTQQIDRLVSSRPQAFAADRGRALRMTADANAFDDMVRAYMVTVTAPAR